MPLAYVGYVRAYERPGTLAAVEPERPFPPNSYRWLDSRYQARHVDGPSAGPRHVSFYQLAPVSVSVELPEAGVVELQLERAVVDSPHIAVCDAIVWSEGGTSGFPEELHGSAWRLLVGEQKLTDSHVV
jgi:hypothetical protein